MSKKKNKKKKKHPNRRTKLDRIEPQALPQYLDLDLIFCTMAKKYRLEKNLLKAIALIESKLDVRACQHEPEFFEQVLKLQDAWKDKDPKIVSSSYGLFRIMFTTAWRLGFRGQAEDLYNPVINTELGAKLLRQLKVGIRTTPNVLLWPLDIALARWHGGSQGNPGEDGLLQDQAYVNKVLAVYWGLIGEEEDCE